MITGGDGADEIWADSYARWDSVIGLEADFIAPDVLPTADDYSRAYFYVEQGTGALLRHAADLYEGEIEPLKSIMFCMIVWIPEHRGISQHQGRIPLIPE